MCPHIDANWTDREEGKQEEDTKEEEEEEDKRGKRWRWVRGTTTMCST